MKHFSTRLLFLLSLSQAPAQALAVQSSLWGSYTYGLSPMPEKIDTSSQTRVGGPGIGGDLTMQYFVPFYFGVVVDYFPIYAESVVFDLEEFGTVDVKASLTATCVHGMVLFPLGEWIVPHDSVAIEASVWRRILRGFFATVTYGPNYFRVRAEVQSVETINRASRIGWSFGAGFRWELYPQLSVRLGVETMKILEAEISLWAVKAGMMYRVVF